MGIKLNKRLRLGSAFISTQARAVTKKGCMPGSKIAPCAAGACLKPA